MEISRHNWFQTLLGMTETSWIKNPIITENINMGEFSVISIGELTDRAKTSIKVNNEIPDFVIYVRKHDDCNDTYFDTSSLQLMNYDTQYPVMFQVASNFNCQENGSPIINFKSGNYLTKLMSDSTQGPSASAGAGAGAILRLAKHLSSNINLLKNTKYCSDVFEGKLYASSHVSELDINRVCIGLHTNVCANFDRSNYGKKCIYHEQGCVIDQVFTSTIINPLKEHTQLTKSLLRAAYLGTYLSALYRQTEVLVLTFIGGGCFNNPFDLIVSAIVNAHVQLAHQSHLKKVILPIFDISRSANQIVTSLLQAGYPRDRIKIVEK